MDREPPSTRSLFEQLTSAAILTEVVAIALAIGISATAAHFVRLWFRRLESRLDADSWQWKLLEGGVAVAFRREIEAAPDPDAKRRELEQQLAARRDPYARAESFGVADLIDPRRTRAALCDWVEWIQPALARQLGPRSYSIRP